MHFLQEWCEIKNDHFRGDAGLQFSINSTNDEHRAYMFSGSSLPLKEIAEIGKYLPDPKGRKYALNIALSTFEVDAERLRQLFSPTKFMVKITPIHETDATADNGITTHDGYVAYYPYKETEEALKQVGFDVLVFVPSLEEDMGRITCGNAILSGTEPLCEYECVA